MKQYSKVPSDVIEKAIDGNKEAIETVPKNYAGYIATLSRSTGSGFNTVDEDTRMRLESKLMAGILKFRIR